MISTTRSHLPSLLSALLFIVGALTFSSVAVIMTVTALGTALIGRSVAAQQTIVLTVSAFQALILVGAAFVSIQRFRGQSFADKDSSFTISTRQVIASLFLAAVALFAGYRLIESDTANWLLLPVLTIPAVALPLFVLLGLAVRGVPLGTRWQSWNVFGLAMTLAPFILIFLELLALAFIVVLVMVFLMSQPGFEMEMQQLSRQMYRLDPQSTEAQELLAPLVVNPGVMAVSLVYFAVIVPLLEELLKPLGVWFFARKLTSPAQGFALGALSGCAYGLIETLGVSAQTAGWAALLLTRIGTGALHITTSALMGAAIVYAIQQRRYLRLLGIYALSVSLHGLWNSLALFFAFATLANTFELQNSLGSWLTPLSVGIGLVTLMLIAILTASNRIMKATLPAPTVTETPSLENH